MKINETNIKNITIEQFKKLLDSLGVTILRNNLIESSKSFPKTSIYYTSNKGDGSFWNGFRKETFPKNRIDAFYVEEVYHNKSKLNVYDNFEKLVFKKFKIEEDLDLATIEDVDVKIILSKIFEVNISADDLNESLKKQLEEQYDKKINDLKEEYEEKIKRIIEKKEKEKKEEVKTLENKYKNMIQELKISLEEKEACDKKLLNYENKLKKILNNVKIQEDIEKFIFDKQIGTIDEIKIILKEGFEDIINNLDNDEDIGKLIVKQYIIYKLMKE